MPWLSPLPELLSMQRRVFSTTVQALTSLDVILIFNLSNTHQCSKIQLWKSHVFVFQVIRPCRTSKTDLVCENQFWNTSVCHHRRNSQLCCLCVLLLAGVCFENKIMCKNCMIFLTWRFRSDYWTILTSLLLMLKDIQGSLRILASLGLFSNILLTLRLPTTHL